MPALRERFEKLGYSDREMQACTVAKQWDVSRDVFDC